MALWSRLAFIAGRLIRQGPLGHLVQRTWPAECRKEPRNAPPAQRRQVTFTIAAIALAAKMARADGQASEAEFQVFRKLFRVPEGETRQAERFYRMAQASTAGFDAYAAQAAKLLGKGSPVLADLLDALIQIARADGIDAAEARFLRSVASLFGFEGQAFERLVARHVDGGHNAYRVLGIEPGASEETIRAAYRRLARENHPDVHLARGVPPEFVRLAEERMAAINQAYARLLRPEGA